MSYGNVGPKPINLHVFEPKSGTAGISLAPGTANGTTGVTVTAGYCYRITAITGELRLGLNPVFSTSGTVTATAQLAVVPAGQTIDWIQPGGYSVIYYGSKTGSAEAVMCPHADEQ